MTYQRVSRFVVRRITLLHNDFRVARSHPILPTPSGEPAAMRRQAPRRLGQRPRMSEISARDTCCKSKRMMTTTTGVARAKVGRMVWTEVWKPLGSSSGDAVICWTRFLFKEPLALARRGAPLFSARGRDVLVVSTVVRTTVDTCPGEARAGTFPAISARLSPPRAPGSPFRRAFDDLESTSCRVRMRAR